MTEKIGREIQNHGKKIECRNVVETSARDIWILGEQSDGRILPITYELMTRGRTLADKREAKLTVVMLGNALKDADLNELIERGADRVLAVESEGLAHFLPEPYTECLTRLIDERRPEILLAGATSTGRTLMPCIAIKANTGLTADCTLLDIETTTGNLLQTRPAIGGNILATIKTPRHRPQMATVRPRSTPQAPRYVNRTGEIIRLPAPPDLPSGRIKHVGFEASSEDQGLADADVVVCVGRGIKRAEHISLARKLADTLGAALGATRDVVDRGWLDYPHQVGLSGKTIAPRLYIGLGISGTIQHIAGMQTAGTIIAVNRDPDAQIFRVADIGIVGDLFEVVPVLIDIFKKGKAAS
ncbi:MAG: electron transfer flavoprotein subunit alpha/FixB family protein [Candidatus Riflebacteria bacterium]|nr:electron transfer flavoprotein subunit alpha/FixB family protein [Candidatus Riflebacteria bacterium]